MYSGESVADLIVAAQKPGGRRQCVCHSGGFGFYRGNCDSPDCTWKQESGGALVQASSNKLLSELLEPLDRGSLVARKPRCMCMDAAFQLYFGPCTDPQCRWDSGKLMEML